jgi:hypothetical protein
MDPDDPRDLKLLWRAFVGTVATVCSVVVLAVGGVLVLI